MDPAACLFCQEEIEYDESALQDDTHFEALKNASKPGSRQRSINLMDKLCKSDSPLQVPLCKGCTSEICSNFHDILKDLEDECVKYDEALNEQIRKKKTIPYDSESLKAELNDLVNQEQELLDELNHLESEEKRLANDIKELNKKTVEINDEGDALYRELRSNHRKLIECGEESLSYKTGIAYMEEQLKTLNYMRVLDLAFYICIDKHYGTINGLRLGRLPHETVEWNEINAAFGQVALLVQVLAEKTGVKFIDYEIDPRGNNSKIRRISGAKHAEYPLFGNGGWKPFGQIALDHAIVGLVNCISHVEIRLKEIHRADNIFLYRIENDRIFENDVIYRLKMQFNSEERWTKAMNLLLQNLRRAIMYTPTSKS